jgi:hypothetical protein
MVLDMNKYVATRRQTKISDQKVGENLATEGAKTDENGNLVNFNSVGWTMTLNLIIYRKIDVLINQLKINKDNIIEEPPPNG